MHHGKSKQSITRKSLSLKKTKNKESVKTGSNANISKYFQKTKSPEIEKDKSPVSSVREPGSQPLAKRQRNDLSEQDHERTSSQSDSSRSNNNFVSNPVKISPVKCVLKIPLGKNGSISTSLLSTRRTDDVIMVNSVGHVLSDTHFPKCEKDVDSPNLSKTLAGDCMDMSDDSIIPPTPSPVDNFKNKSRISVSGDKDGKTSYSSSMVQRDYKHIKKPSISLSLNVKRSKIKRTQNSKCNESLHISESVQKNLTVNKRGCGGNHECFYNMENDLSVVSCNTIKTNEKGNESGNVDSVRSSAMKLARKTFKLSKKVKRADGGKSFSSNKKLGPGDVEEESDNDMLLGYGVQVNTVDKVFVKNDEVGGENDECKNQEFTIPQVKTRRKLSLDWSKNSHATNKVQATKTEPTDNKLYMSNAQDNILSQENMFDQERSLSEPTREKVEDMLNVSLTSDVSDEVCQLVDNISWSPLEIKSKRQNVLVSPAKQYVRSKSTETNTLAGDVVVQDKTSNQNADSSKQGYRRFLVLEVYRREILDNAAARNAGIEKVLRLFDESDNSEKCCQLRGEWERTEVEHGDIVNIIGKQTETGSYILNNVDENYIVVYPDILVTPISISTSTKCLRRSVLDKYFKTEGPNQVMFLGTLLHRIFEASLTAKVLRDVEMFGIRKKKDSPEYETEMQRSWKTFLKFTYSTNDQKTTKNDSYIDDLRKESKKDNTSHFILRLAYCRSEELRRWFIAQEVELFKFRFKYEAEKFENIEKFFEENKLKYTPISKQERHERSSYLACANFKMDESIVKITDYYKVPFTEALDFVRSRKVYLEKGFAFVPRDGLISIISNCFRTHLSHALAVTARSLPYLEEDERLLPRLTSLSRQYLGQGYDSKKQMPGGKITLGQIDSLSKTSFPLCMRQLHEALRRDHHLKHGGRLQYGLFIKGIGLTLEEALMFWRSEFTRIMEVDKFEKGYAYNVRHSYVKEGKRADYTPYSCMKIIMSNHPGQGDYHGCPFRHSDAHILRQKLVSYGVPYRAIKEIQDLVKDSHYQLACARYFEVTHEVSLLHTDGVNHPNKYVQESRRVREKLASGSIKQQPLASTSISHIAGSSRIKTERVTQSRSQTSSSANKTNDVIDCDVAMDDELDDGVLESMDALGY